MKTAKILVLAAAAVLIASCCECRKTGGKAATLLDTTWQLAELEGKAVKAEGEKYTLHLSIDGRATGMGDCNRIMGNYTNPLPGAITLGPFASTRMLCPDQDAEGRFVKALESVDAYRIDGKTMMLFSGGSLKMILAEKEKKK